MKKKLIYYVASEAYPFAQTGGLAEVAGSLPKAIMQANKAYQVCVVMPLYRIVEQKHSKLLRFLGSTEVTLAWRKVYCGFFVSEFEGVTYYFIDNKYYFDRDELYGHYDDGERFAFFSKAIFSLFKYTKEPTIIHSNDWHSALVNIYLDILYKKEGKHLNIKSVFTIHNIQFQGIFNTSLLEDVLGIDLKYLEILEYNGLINLMKGALVTSDLVTTVSPRYAKEIKTMQYAWGLENITRLIPEKLEGILNGINIDFYDPTKDIYYPYSYLDITNKQKNKLALQKQLGLRQDENIPLMAIISRLTTQKGLNLVVDVFGEIMKLPIQVVILGKGDEYYQDKFMELAKNYLGKVASIITFDILLSKQIYAGSDLFLMPSKTEPCGLSQMIACRYGTIPIVRATGGLFDSIKDYYEQDGNGFVFRDFDAYQMLEKIKQALNLYSEQTKFTALQIKNMQIDFSWQNSAKEYLEKYAQLLKK